jgi:glucose/arabinose dehydrogenase
MLSRTQFLSAFGLTAAAALFSASPVAAQTSPIESVRIAAGLSLPLWVGAAPGDPTHLYILEQGTSGTARIKLFDRTTNLVLGTPFLTITGISTGGERGLLGLAFPDDYATSGFFYVYISDSAASNMVRRYTRLTPTTADPASAFTILQMADPESNHNGGWMDFGPDGFLYIATGDGGGANDQHGTTGNGQNINSYLGKILRIDPAGPDAFPADATKNYAIPSTNPFFGAIAGLDEIWHYGLRNPWRDSFDRLTGDMWIGDVGQNAFEEIDFVPAGASALNFGWRCMEGLSCTGLSGCTCNDAALTLPVHTYSLIGSNCAVTGGYRYRGSALCDWQGQYFFADFCSSQIFSFGFNGTSITNLTNRTAQLAPGGGLAISSIASFGEDESGELYIVDQGGEIFKIVPGNNITDCNMNGVHDSCDIASGTSQDVNADGIPDECQPTVTPFCFGDGTGTPCPCGNAGAPGAGCANSFNPLGATLVAVGLASLGNDTFTLIGAGMTERDAMYFQGTIQESGGAGMLFGDGLRCAGGTVVRLASKLNVGGTSQYPDVFETPISVRGLIQSAPATRTYQCWYRNSEPTFCTTSTFNLSNGLSVGWVN